MLYLLAAVHHELEHEAAHLSRMSVLCSLVIHNGDVASSLYEAMEVIRIYGHLIVYGGQSVSLSYGVGNEERVVYALRHVALVA